MSFGLPGLNTGTTEQGFNQKQGMFGNMENRAMQRRRQRNEESRYATGQNFLQNAWNTIQPQQPFFGAGGAFGMINPYGPGGDSKRPTVSSGPIWNGQQIQGKVNASRGQNDAITGNRISSTQGDLAWRGFGSFSPLGAALAAQMGGQNLQANTANDQTTRWNAAEGNARHVQAGQIANAQASNAYDAARNNLFGNMMQAQQGIDNGVTSQRNALVAAMADFNRA